MELLIVFIVMMVLSSIFKSFRGAGGRASPQPTPRQPEKPVIPVFTDLSGKNVEETQSYGLDFLEWPEYGQKTKTVVKKIYKQKMDDSVLVRESPGRQISRFPKAVVSSGGSRREAEKDIGKGLQELLSGEKLPLGIVAAEIFSAPRARRPFGRKIK